LGQPQTIRQIKVSNLLDPLSRALEWNPTERESCIDGLDSLPPHLLPNGDCVVSKESTVVARLPPVTFQRFEPASYLLVVLAKFTVTERSIGKRRGEERAVSKLGRNDNGCVEVS
jgi:hypothetical protein